MRPARRSNTRPRRRTRLEEIGFSDHSPMPRDDFDEWRMRPATGRIRRQGPAGAEADFPSSPSASPSKWIICPATRTGSGSWPSGIRGIISSARVHYVSDSWDIDNPAKLSEWKKRDAFEVGRLISTGSRSRRNPACSTSSATRICPKNSASGPRGIARRCTKCFWRRGQVRLRHGAQHRRAAQGLQGNLPSRPLLRLAFQIGVPITFGSDAHTPEEVGMNFAEAVQLARAAGYHGMLPVLRPETAHGCPIRGHPARKRTGRFKFWRAAFPGRSHVRLPANVLASRCSVDWQLAVSRIVKPRTQRTAPAPPGGFLCRGRFAD